MRKEEREPFLPFVTVDDILKFDPQREETFTESRFMNAVLRAIYKVGAGDTRKIASHLAIEEHMLNHGVRIVCGITLMAVRSVVTIKTAAEMRADDPKCRLEDVAARLGYSNRATVWRILNNKKYSNLAHRLCPELLQRRNQERLTKEEWYRIFDL